MPSPPCVTGFSHQVSGTLLWIFPFVSTWYCVVVFFSGIYVSPGSAAAGVPAITLVSVAGDLLDCCSATLLVAGRTHGRYCCKCPSVMGFNTHHARLTQTLLSWEGASMLADSILSHPSFFLAILVPYIKPLMLRIQWVFFRYTHRFGDGTQVFLGIRRHDQQALDCLVGNNFFSFRLLFRCSLQTHTHFWLGKCLYFFCQPLSNKYFKVELHGTRIWPRPLFHQIFPPNHQSIFQPKMFAFVAAYLPPYFWVNDLLLYSSHQNVEEVHVHVYLIVALTKDVLCIDAVVMSCVFRVRVCLWSIEVCRPACWKGPHQVP